MAANPPFRILNIVLMNLGDSECSRNRVVNFIAMLLLRILLVKNNNILWAVLLSKNTLLLNAETHRLACLLSHLSGYTFMTCPFRHTPTSKLEFPTSTLRSAICI